MRINEGVKFDLMFYRSKLEFGLGGVRCIFIVHPTDCCIKRSACLRSQSRISKDVLKCISLAWVNALGGMKALIIDGEIGIRGKEVDWAMCSQLTMKHTAPHQQIW